MKREEFYTAIESFLSENKIGEKLIPRELVAELSERLAKLSLPPAEGAEAIVKKYEDEYDFKFHWVQRDRVIRMMREFAAQQQPTAEGAEKLSAKKYLADNGYGSGFNYTTNQVAYLMQEFTTLHAQRIADKMVEERLRAMTERCKKLEFMIENGLGWEDMRNDITMPHEL
jgi:hypothetical protein